MNRVLVIEDNIITLDELEYRLNQMSFIVETAVCATEALEKIDGFEPTIILSDINLGAGIDGIEMVNKINQERNIPVIYITAYDDEITYKRAKTTEPYAFISKPIQEKELKIAIDIALFKSKTEKELRELNAVKDKLFSIISHDLISPISSGIGLLTSLSENINDISKEEITNYIELIINSNQQSYDLVTKLLQWSKTQLNGVKIVKKDICLLKFTKTIIHSLKNSAKDKEIEIKTAIDKHLHVNTDKDIIELVLRNLISNAIKYTKKGGVVTIESQTSDENQEIIISVIDNGVGMTQKQIDGLFSICECISTPGTNGEKGNGLGLNLCNDFLKKLDTRLNVKSEIGKGSSFSFSLHSLVSRSDI